MDKRLIAVVKILEVAPELIERVVRTLEEEGYPNIPCSCKRDFKLWLTLAEWRGWCLQRNCLTDHCRILDPDDIRRAWGTKKAMFDTLDQVCKLDQEKRFINSGEKI